MRQGAEIQVFALSRLLMELRRASIDEGGDALAPLRTSALAGDRAVFELQVAFETVREALDEQPPGRAQRGGGGAGQLAGERGCFSRQGPGLDRARDQAQGGGF